MVLVNPTSAHAAETQVAVRATQEVPRHKVAAVLTLTGTAHVIPLVLAGAMAEVFVVLNLLDEIHPLPPGLTQRFEHYLIFYKSAGGVVFLLVFRELVGNFFVRKRLVGVRGFAPITAIRRQGRADRLFIFLFLFPVAVVVGVVSVRLCLRIHLGCDGPGDFVVYLKAIIADRRVRVDWNVPAKSMTILRFPAEAVWVWPSTIVAVVETAPASAK